MDTINLAEQKLKLFQKIMSIENEKILSKLFIIADKFVTKNNTDYTYNNIENIDIATLSFNEWNKLFMQEKDLNEYIPEYEMTLRDYRMKLFNAEKGESYPINQFFKKLESYV